MSNPKKILVSGVSGQDGSYMVDYLLENTDHEIYGLVRRTSKPDYSNLKESLKSPRFKLVTGDLNDSSSINKVVAEVKPDYFINLAAQSFVKSSWDVPEQTLDTNSTGVIRCLEAIKQYSPNCRFYNAGSSEEFGDVQYSPQDEKHPLRARSPYGASKIAARQIVKTYRESDNLYAIQGYLFNHESPKRGEEFVTRKITLGVARIINAIRNKQPFEPIVLGNIDAKRDWSHAKDFVEGIWKMMNQELYRPDLDQSVFKDLNHQNDAYSCSISSILKEYVLSSNETHSVREFIKLAFNCAGLEVYSSGGGVYEKFFIADYINDIGELKSSLVIEINPKYYRPAEVDLLHGDSSLARTELNWTPKYSFNDLVNEMVNEDIKNYERN